MDTTKTKTDTNTAKMNTINLVMAGMFTAIGVVMPNFFHSIAGPSAGSMFLPLFWAIGLAALMLPMKFAVLVAIILPLISHLTSGMPAVPMLYFMLIELIVYSIVVFSLNKRFNPFVSIALGLTISRIVYISTVFFAAEVLGFPAPYAGIAMLVSGILMSTPGIIAQIIILPMLYKISKKVGF